MVLQEHKTDVISDLVSIYIDTIYFNSNTSKCPEKVSGK